MQLAFKAKGLRQESFRNQFFNIMGQEREAIWKKIILRAGAHRYDRKTNI